MVSCAFSIAEYQQSIHATARPGGKPAAACSDCHSTHEIRAHSGAPPPLRKAYAEIVCAKCHAANDTVYKASAHGVALAAGVEGAPNCIDCHGEHGARAPSDTLAATSRRNVAAMCLKCHRDNPEVGATVGPSAAFVASYENSVHARAVHQGRGGHGLAQGPPEPLQPLQVLRQRWSSAQVIGLDSSPEMIEEARRTYEIQILPESVDKAKKAGVVTELVPMIDVQRTSFEVGVSLRY